MDIKKKFAKKKWLLRWCAFLLIFSLLFQFISYLVRPVNTYNRLNIVDYYHEQKNTLDMVYIGGSAAFVYWMPYEAWSEYGIVSKVFAYNSIPADAIKASIQEALKTQSPDLLVLDARPFQYRENIGLQEVYIRNFSDSIHYSWNRAKFLFKAIPLLNDGELNNFNDYFFDISKYHNLWKTVNQSSWKLALNEPIDTDDIKFGFQFIRKIEPVPEPLWMNIQKQKPVNSVTNRILQELMDYCKTLEQKVLFVVSPFGETEEQKKTYNYIESIITQNGFEFLNTNDYIDAMKLDYTHDFYNVSHVNALGAKKYTSFLGAYIQEHYVLPNRKEDPAYSQWNEVYPQWKLYLDDMTQKIQALIDADESPS